MSLRPLLSFILAFTLFALNSFAQAATLSLSNVPLYLGGSVAPNVVLTLDDSGSMQWENMPDDNWTYYLYPPRDDVYGGSDYGRFVPFFTNASYNVRIRSPHVNKVYYNPEVTYVPWSDSDGTSMGNVSPSCAPHNPENTSLGCRNLTQNNTEAANWEYYNGGSGGFPGGVWTNYQNHTFYPAVYYRYTGGDTWNASNYQRVEIRSGSNYTGGPDREDCANAPVCSYQEEIQNFANWYSYYRSRILAARAGIGRAFGSQGQGMRVGFAAINQGGKTLDNVWSDQAMIAGVRPFSGTNRDNFFDQLYGRNIGQSGTPLRSATKNVGDYYERTDNRGPWGETPGSDDNTAQLTCRQSYNILMTDGYWNGSDPSVGNSDNNNGLVISGPNNDDYQYTPERPYLDSWSNTLADVAMDFWKRDLRTDLANEVPTNSADPAFWQHMVTFTVGLGVNGTLDPATDLPLLTSGALDWPQPSDDAEENIDDLWHAAVNSRGEFFSAADPDTFADSLSAILSNISDRTSSASSVALNAGTISSDSRVYQARFNSGDWTGQMLAFAVNTDGSLSTNPVWDAADLIPAHGSRQIFTYDGSDGQVFSWANLSGSQQSALGNQNVFNYLRGDQSLELNNGGSYRNRNSLLGDIIHSSPAYVAMPVQRYPDFFGSGAAENVNLYSTFKSNNLNRQPVIYVGANDGMLHAFNADTGVELFSYVPASVYDNLSDLTAPGYSHRYYVDDSPTVVDAFIDGSWKTVLVSGLGAGGQGIFALDVTDPENFDEDSVLWEFSDSNNSDLGYTFGKPSIVRMQNGDWAAVFSGGYNNTEDNAANGSNGDSTTGNAALYIVDIADGSLIKKLNTNIGSADDPTGANRPNGLASPAMIDIDSDAVVDLIYVGDLFGNLWKIDVTSDDPGQWDFAMKQGNEPRPLYSACASASCTAANRQPITTQPQVINHPTGSGYLVLFGTGKYFEVGDNATSNQTTQSFYGIWDKAANAFTAFDRSDILQQSITDEISSNGFELRVTTANTIDWSTDSGWYLDLIDPDTSSNEGERQVSDAVVRNGRVIFTTLLPSDEPCDDGGTSWLMELDASSGSRLDFSPFDIDGDSAFTVNDYVNVGDIDGDGEDDYLPPSGKRSKEGITATPGIANSGNGMTEIKYSSGSTGNIETTIENPGPGAQGRQSWRQLDSVFRRN